MLIDRIFNGNDAVYGLTCQAVEEAIAQHGADKAVEFPHTAYCLPCYYAVTGVKVKTLGEMKEALGVIKSLMTREHQLDDALMSGVATALCAEFIEVLKYLDGAEPYSAAAAGGQRDANNEAHGHGSAQFADDLLFHGSFLQRKIGLCSVPRKGHTFSRMFTKDNIFCEVPSRDFSTYFVKNDKLVSICDADGIRSERTVYAVSNS